MWLRGTAPRRAGSSDPAARLPGSVSVLPALPVPVTVRLATPADVDLLADMGARTFRDAFGPDNDPADVERHVAATYAPATVAAELARPDSTFLIAESDGRPAGYALLTAGSAIKSVAAEAPVELARIYVESAATGNGVGGALMAAVLGQAARGGHDAIWLGVWERNVRAVRFYERWGFRAAGDKTFTVGLDVQRDIVMAQRLPRQG